MNFLLNIHAKIYGPLNFFQPYELLKKILKILKVSKEIFYNNISHYPKTVIDFEENFAKFIGRRHGLTFCNGTSSIEAALFSMEIGAGDEVLVPSCTFHASIDPIVNIGAIPVFVDISGAELEIDLNDLKGKITSKTKCILAVHLFGNPSNIEEISKVAKENNLYLLEDCSHVHGAKVGAKRLGAFGDIACFSLQGEKAVAAGEGGIAVTDNKDFFVRMSLYGHFKRHADLFEEKYQKYAHTGLGFKRRAHPIGIAMAGIDLKFLDYYNKKMNQNLFHLKNIFVGCNWITFASLENTLNTRGGFFGGVPVVIDTEKVSLKSIVKSFASAGIIVRKYPFELHHMMEHYTSKSKHLTLPQTESLQSKLLLLDRKLLVSQSLYTRLVLKNIKKEIERNNNL